MATGCLKDVQRLIKKWRRILWIGDEWNIKARVIDDEAEADEDTRDVVAYIVVLPEVWSANLTVNAWKLPEGGLEQAIVHELTHIIMQPIATILECGLGEKFEPVAEQHVEAITERFSRILVDVHRRKRA